MRRLYTALCDLLGIEYPIIQSGMGGVAGVDLAAEVSRAGGLGVIAGLLMAPEDLRKAIRRARELTDRPFAVNLLLHSAMRPPVDPATIEDDTLHAVQDTLNTFRTRLGVPVPAAGGRPPGAPDLVDAALAVILEERVPVWSIGLGNPDAAMVRECHGRGITVMAMVATVDDARTVASSGVDIIVAQGGEAGGHRSTWVKPKSAEAACVGTMVLVPQILDAVGVPVVAAGGIIDGRGLAAALALGASGALMGTRFVATRESLAAEFWKKRVLEADGVATVVTDVFSGHYARALGNVFSSEYAAAGAPVLPWLLQRNAAADVYAASLQQATGDFYPMWAGQGVGLIHNLPGAAEVVETIVRETRDVLTALGTRVHT